MNHDESCLSGIETVRKKQRIRDCRVGIVEILVHYMNVLCIYSVIKHKILNGSSK